MTQAERLDKIRALYRALDDRQCRSDTYAATVKQIRTLADAYREIAHKEAQRGHGDAEE